MSMRYFIMAITAAQIATLHASPSLVKDIVMVAQEDAEAPRRQAIRNHLPPEKRQDAERRDQALQAQPEFNAFDQLMANARTRFANFGPTEPALPLDKSWHILHYAFTGNIVPIGSSGDALMSGDDIGEDVGFGPARILSPKATAEFSKFVAELDLKTLQSRINYPAMLNAGVYAIPMGSGTAQEHEGDLRQEVANYFPHLKDYLAHAAERGDGLLMWLS